MQALHRGQGHFHRGTSGPLIVEDGKADELLTAVGKLSEAMEWVERARGRLYDFHQMSGRADLLVA